MTRRGITDGLGLKYQGLSHSDSRSSSTGAALPMQNLLCQKSHRVPLLSAARGCVICGELCGIRSASFGPIRKQIRGDVSPSTHSWPLRLGILGKQVSSMPRHSSPIWGGGGREPLNNDRYSTRDWTEAGLSKILLHLVRFNRLQSRRGSKTLSSVLRLL